MRIPIDPLAKLSKLPVVKFIQIHRETRTHALIVEDLIAGVDYVSEAVSQVAQLNLVLPLQFLQPLRTALRHLNVSTTGQAQERIAALCSQEAQRM